MHDASVTPAADDARNGSAAALAEALQASRRDTLATFAVYERSLPGLVVPQRDDLNPPRWELGHVGWFQEYWLARNPVRADGAAADPQARRLPSIRPDADELYDSSRVAHDARWTLPLPDAAATLADLDAQATVTQQLLRDANYGDDDTLYFFRLALLHEDMHHEAALYMAQALGIAIDDPRWQAVPLPPPPAPLALARGPWSLGNDGGAGFAFDNELCAHNVALADSLIDAQVVRWAEFLPFVETGAYVDDRWWSPQGRRWRAAHAVTAPRYLRRDGNTWEHWRNGQWQPLYRAEAACHLSCYEAEAWCDWAGRRLPTEAEWERAAVTEPQAFRWGDVWEWTASAFEPFPGFAPHPYRDYSAPWFDGRPVLRGASYMTQPRMRHPRYRNFFAPFRTDLAAGFRSCERRAAS